MTNIKEEIQKVINLYKSQKFFEAEKLGKELIKRNPKVSFLYNLLGLILSGQLKFDDAIQYYEEGLKIEPNYSMIYNNLGTAYKSKKNYLKAEECYKESIKLDNKLPEAYNNLGNLYMDLNKIDDAISNFKKSIEVNQKFYIAHFNLGILYKSIGKFNESKECLNIVLKLFPNFYSAHRAYSQINKYQIDDEHINVMKSLYEETEKNTSGKIALSFALGKAFEDLKDYKKAITYINTGNKLRRSEIEFNLNKEVEEFSNIKKVFSKKFIEAYANIGNDDNTPIFILGMPRSGTTLVEQIISNHPDVFGGDELNLFDNLIKNYFYKNKNFSIENIDQGIKDKFKEIGLSYINKIKEISGDRKRVTDKLPINFKWVGFIKLIFPNSKIIHCVRNSKDTCMSIYKNYFTSAQLNYAYNIDELVNFYNLYKDIMNFWKKNFPNFIFEVKYENLVHEPDKIIRDLIKNCDLKWNDSCISFYNNNRTIKTASDTQARSKIFKSSVDSWKNYKEYLPKNFNKLEN